MTTSRVTLVAALMFTLASQLPAQTPPVRSGFGLSLGMGLGNAGIDCEDCGDIEKLEGISGYARIGSYVSSRFFIGVEGTGWIKNSDDVERRIAVASLSMLGYPDDRAGFFVRGGVGYMRAVIESGGFSVVGAGLSYQAGLGWDLPGSSAVSLTPYVTYVGSTQVAAYFNDVATGYSLNPNILQFGLAITVH